MVTAAARIHGGPDAQGVAQHDFSTNANACGPCPAALAAVRNADPCRYPDPSGTALREQLARFHGVDSSRIALAASGSEFIFRVTAWARHAGARRVSVPAHAYGDYAQAALASGLALSGPGEPAQLAWACEPSSPLGQAQAGLADLAASRAIVVLDRAYEPLRLQGEPRLDAALLDRVWQLWTPNKALGLTGVRGAYAIAPLQADGAVAELDAMCPSWPLGAHGVALLQAWCDGEIQDWLAGSRKTLRGWKQRQVGLCEALGWSVLPSDANFFCAQPPSVNLAALRAQGIALRDCASFGLPGHVRLSVQPPDSQDALARAWRLSS